MRRLRLAAACWAAICAAPAAAQTTAPADTPRLTTEERAKVIELLGRSQDELLAAIANLSDAQWTYKPGPARWSAGEVAEHILLSEAWLFGAVEQALARDADPGWASRTAGKTELLERVMPSRDRRAQAPEPLQRFTGLPRDELVGRFKAARARTLRFAAEAQAPLKQHTLDHPFKVFGTLSAYQWLLYIPLHNLRHNLQIAEVKASAEFPK